MKRAMKSKKPISPPQMTEEVVLKVENLSKKFCRTLRRSMFYGTADVLRSMFGIPFSTDRTRKDEFWALEDISFELQRGDTLGIVGVNGSGKSTLLRLITGIFPPDKGRISFRGRIGALIAVGAGFHPNMTGRENIYLNGTILGMTRKEVEARFDAIVDFAEVGEFLEAPVSTYSSGMRVRLGFAVAIHCEPELLLVDEVLAVGDAGFQLKCFNKMGELRARGVTTILVSHNLHHMSSFCNRIMVMEKGRLIHFGDVEEGLAVYKSKISMLKSSGEIEKINTGTEDFFVESIEFSPPVLNDRIVLEAGQNLSVVIRYEAARDFDDMDLDIVLRLPMPSASDYFQATNHAFGQTISIKKGRGILAAEIEGINLNNITAHLIVTLWTKNREEIVLWWRNIPVSARGENLQSGWARHTVKYSVRGNE